jgi:hypothetical protein
VANGHGGRRQGAGKPSRAAAAARAASLAATIAKNTDHTPPEVRLQAIASDPRSSRMEIIKACAELMKRPLIEARKPVVETEIRVWNLPRYSQVEKGGRILWPDDDSEFVGPLQPVKPFKATNWTSESGPQHTQPDEPLPVEESPDDGTVVPLRPWKPREPDEGGGQGAA